MLGGLLLLAMAGLVVVSVIGRRFFNSPVNGDFELVRWRRPSPSSRSCPTRRRGAATSWSTPSRAGCPRAPTRCIDAFWDLVYAGHDGLLAACLIDGACEHYRSGQTTMLLQLAVWPAIAISTALAGPRSRSWRWRPRSGCRGGAHERAHASPFVGFGAMLLLIALRMPIGLSMLVVGRARLRLPVELVGVLRLHEDEPLPPVRQLHAVGHPAVHPDGRAGRAIGPLHGAVPRRRGVRRAHARRAGDGRHLGLHGVRRHLRLVGRHHRHLRPRRAARAAALQVRRGFATGTIAVGGTLGILIPPSVILVVYAITTEQNIAKLFKAALIPGLMAALFYCIAIAWSCAAGRTSRPMRRSHVGKRLQALGRRLAGAAGRADGGRRHLRRRVHADRGRRRRRHRHAAGRRAQRSLCPGGHRRQPADGRDHRHDLHHPAGLGGVQRLPGALAAADPGGRMGRPSSGLPPYAGHGLPAGVLHPARRGDGRTRHAAA